MIRNLKALGLALVAALALTAVVASTAFGEDAQGRGELTSKSGTYPLNLSAESNESEKFTAFGSEVTCTTAKYKASLAGPSTSVTITPEYSNCHAIGPFGLKFPATVTMNKCDFVLFDATTNPAGSDTYAVGSTEIKCEKAGEVIEIHVYENSTKHSEGKSLCTMTVTQQTVANGPTITNNTTAGDITLSGSVTGLHAIEHTSSSLCPEGSGEHTTTAAKQDLATGGVTVTGKDGVGNANPFHVG